MNEPIKRAQGPLVYRGPKEICAACGLNYQKMTRYVKVYGMPAFKVDGAWVALPRDLVSWLEDMREQEIQS